MPEQTDFLTAACVKCSTPLLTEPFEYSVIQSFTNSEHSSIPTFEHSNFQAFKHSNIQTFEHSNIRTFGQFPRSSHGFQLRRKIQGQCMRKLRRCSEGNVHITLQHLRDVRTRDMHPLRELGLREAHCLHLQKNLAEEGRDDMVDCFGHLIYCSFLLR